MKSLLARSGIDWHYFFIALLACGVGAATFVYSLQYRATAEAESAKEALITEMNLMREQLVAIQAKNEELHSLLQTQMTENEVSTKRVEELSNTVNYFDKLSKTDRELLQKYSSVYFLNENYVPTSLSPVGNELLARPGTSLLIHSNVYQFLANMMNQAQIDGAPLRVLSAYRSFGEQSILKSSYKVTYGAGTANTFSADQGYSEHQLGSAVDFSTPENPESLTAAFKDTKQFRWLVSHAHEYGFVLSYPHGNSYFQFEPWHWRFVGTDLANRLYQENKYFYDLDQREVSPYLARIFD